MKTSFVKFRFLSLWMLFSAWSAKAEFIPPINIGSMYLSEYQIPHSSMDSAFGAVILFNYINRYIAKGDYPVGLREVRRIKILNKNGMYFANLDVTNLEFINEDVVIYVHNLEGDQIVTRKINASDLKKLVLQYKGQKKIPLPYVKVGSVIETDMTSRNDLPNFILFQFDIPCIWSGVRMIHYPEDSIQMVYQGMDKPDTYIQNRIHSDLLKEDVVERVIIMKNLFGSFETRVKYNYNLVNEFKAVFLKVEENYTTKSVNDFLGYPVHDRFEGDFFIWYGINQFSKKDSVRIKNYLEAILKPGMTTLEKSKAIHQFVSKSFNFNN